MMNSKTYIACLFLLSFLLGSCDLGDLRKWEITLDKDSKKPYGSYLAHESMKLLFPSAEIKDLSPSMRFNTLDGSMKYNNDGASLLVLTGLDFNVSDNEWLELQAFVREGNELVLFASNFDRKILQDLNIIKQGGGEQNALNNKKQLTGNKGILMLNASMLKRYGYEGRSLNGFFQEMRSAYAEVADITQKAHTDTLDIETQQVYSGDTTAVDNNDTVQFAEDAEPDYSSDDETSYTIADTISYADGKPDCLRIQMGRGHIMLHAAPLVMSNYFLLQDGNIDYLSGIWKVLPGNIKRVYWDNYFRHSGVETSSNALWTFEATRWGLLLAFFVIAVYVIFQMKRRQRIVPVIAPLRNDTVSFVETVGRLYYNTGNNVNLAEKMVQQYLEWVRIKCFLNTSRLNDDFVQQLAIKTGHPIAMVTELVNMIHEVRLGSAVVDDAYLYQLYRIIQHFYKNHR